MWCLETIKQINQAQAKGLNAYEAYEASGIRVLGDSKPHRWGGAGYVCVDCGAIKDTSFGDNCPAKS